MSEAVNEFLGSLAANAQAHEDAERRKKEEYEADQRRKSLAHAEEMISEARKVFEIPDAVSLEIYRAEYTSTCTLNLANRWLIWASSEVVPADRQRRVVKWLFKSTCVAEGCFAPDASERQWYLSDNPKLRLHEAIRKSVWRCPQHTAN